MPQYEIWFDGGILSKSKGIPYGSCEVDINEKPQGILRWVDSDKSVTSNEAEYIALKQATIYFLTNYQINEKDQIIIYGDSELVRNQIGKFRKGVWVGAYKCNLAHLVVHRDQIRVLLQYINKLGGNISYQHMPRKQIVKKLGH